MGASGYMVGRVDALHKDFSEYKTAAAKEALTLAKEQVNFSKEYVLKSDYKCDIDDLKKQLGRMDDKLDGLLAKSRTH